MGDTFTYAEMAKQSGSWQRRAQYEVDTIHQFKANIDEVALLFAGPSELNAWVTWAKGQGYEHFGSIEQDRMVRLDQEGQFDIRFEFLRLEGFPFRIEAMTVLDGQAPLHEEALGKFSNGSVIHVSWRAAPNGDAEGYQRHRAVLEAGGTHGALSMLAEYENSYGRFAYYGEQGRPPYFKPRVNLRDVAA